MIVLIIGRRQLGKTTLARYFAHKHRPRILIDPRAQFNTTGEPMTDVDPESILTSLETGEDVLIQPRDRQLAVDQAAWSAEQFILSREHPGRTLSVVFDEAGLYNLRAWDYLMRASPVPRTSFVMAAHRPKDIDTDVRALADLICIFRTTQEHDLDVIEDRTSRHVRDLVPTLKPREFVSWNDNDADAVPKIHRDPTAWYVPSDQPIEGVIAEPPPTSRQRGLW